MLKFVALFITAITFIVVICAARVSGRIEVINLGLSDLEKELIEGRLDPMEFVKIINEQTDKEAEKQIKIDPPGQPREYT